MIVKHPEISHLKRAVQNAERAYLEIHDKYPHGVPGLPSFTNTIIRRTKSIADEFEHVNHSHWRRLGLPPTPLFTEDRHTNAGEEWAAARQRVDAYTHEWTEFFYNSLRTALESLLFAVEDKIEEEMKPIREKLLQQHAKVVIALIKYERAIDRLWLRREVELRLRLSEVGLANKVRCHRDISTMAGWPSGIYFLFDEELEYVGQSKSVRRRLYGNGHEIYEPGRHLIGVLEILGGTPDVRLQNRLRKERSLIVRLSPSKNDTYNKYRDVEADQMLLEGFRGY